jgi:hypothetical protein
MLVHILGVLMRMPIWMSHKHAISTRKLCSLAISMLMSILQNVGTYTGRAYEIPYMGCLISTLNLVISMLMSILQDVGTYTGRAYENANMGVS